MQACTALLGVAEGIAERLRELDTVDRVRVIRLAMIALGNEDELIPADKLGITAARSFPHAP